MGSGWVWGRSPVVVVDKKDLYTQINHKAAMKLL